jgi:VIT1/CCC1 family predicted Fe2+/Mn2+ transporter
MSDTPAPAAPDAGPPGATPNLEHAHTPEAIAERLDAGPEQSYLRDWVFGGIDGAVTTFAVVTGVVGADLSPGIILILGFANLLADGFSMAAGNFTATRSEREQFDHYQRVEERHIRVAPEGEREELRQIFQRKGFAGDELEGMVERIAADRKLWVRTMLTEEYGLPLEVRSPWSAAGATMAAFIVCGLIPLMPWLVGAPGAIAWSVGLTAATFCIIGGLKSRWSVRHWFWTSGETLAVGGGAAGLSWVIGRLLRDVVAT